MRRSLPCIEKIQHWWGYAEQRCSNRTEFSPGWEVLGVADRFSGLTSGRFRPLILQERPDSGVVYRQVFLDMRLTMRKR
jgi:hypothetical protein